MVGGKYHHNGVRRGIFAPDKPGGKRHAGSGVAPFRLADDVGFRNWQKLPALIHVVSVGNDQNVLRVGQRKQPQHGVLDHGGFAGKLQELLGQMPSPHRPEPLAAAAGHNHCVKSHINLLFRRS
ncbi:hypothetical protein SDC9_188308 [bioreactor metagenome]|uniref:Uncharacterized protein n=1 Tax=bioreactor metagenome TaxID=1076179 RepID=A0A645HRD5_9ZZZZ